MPEFQVSFNIEMRPLSPEQQAAGKRLFSRLLDRALTNPDKPELTLGRGSISDHTPAAPADGGGQSGSAPAGGGS